MLCLPQDLSGFQAEMFDDIVRRSPPMKGKRSLYHQGNRFANLYVVRSGCVKKIHYTQDGTEQIIGFSLPGELLGLNAIATDQYNETAMTLNTTSVCKLDYARFEELCEKIPGLAKQVLKMAGQELIEEQNLRLTISAKNAEERLAMFYSSLSTRFQLLGYSPYEFILSMNRLDIGNYLGMTYETVSRTTMKLVKQGLIEIDRKHVKIKDPEGLKVLAGHCEVCPSLNISNL